MDIYKVGIDLAGGKVHIFDLNEPGCRIEVDQVVFFAKETTGQVVEGTVAAVHGLPLEIADILPYPMLRHLGVGAVRRLPPVDREGPAGVKLFRACKGDKSFHRVHAP